MSDLVRGGRAGTGEHKQVRPGHPQRYVQQHHPHWFEKPQRRASLFRTCARLHAACIMLCMRRMRSYGLSEGPAYDKIAHDPDMRVSRRKHTSETPMRSSL